MNAMLLVHEAIPDEFLGGPRVDYLYWLDVEGNKHTLKSGDSNDGSWVLASDGMYPSAWEAVAP